MGFWSSLKRLFFATESVTKSAVNKGVEYTKEKSHEVYEEGKEKFRNLEEKTSGLREAIVIKAGDLADKAENFAENIGDRVTETGHKAWDKAGDFAEKAEDLAEKAGDFITDAGTRVWEKGEELVDRAGQKFSEVRNKPEDADDVAAVALTTENSTEKMNDAASETGNKVWDKVENLANKTEEFVEKASHEVVETVDQLKERNVDTSDSIPTNTSNVTPTPPENVTNLWEKSGDIAEKVGDKVVETSHMVWDKTSDIAEKVGDKVVETSNQVWDKTADLAEKVGEKVREGSETLVEKAKELTSKLEDKFDETLEKAKKMEAEDAAKPKKDFADDTLDVSGSLLENKDDFFKKASHYADGHYDAFSEGKVVITNPQGLDNDKKDDEDKDIDGLIDDAVVVKE